MKKLVLGRTLALVLALGLVPANAAMACCIYNNSHYRIQVESHIDGMRNEVIAPGARRCTRGTGGDTANFWMLALSKNQVISTSGTLWVAKHGWICVSAQEDRKWKATSFNADGSVHGATHLEPN